MSIAKDHLCIKSKDTIENSNPLLEYENGHLIGKNPLSLDENLLEDAGHIQTPIAKIIRKKCLDCCGFQAGEVRKCVAISCPLWPYRMGKNPFLSAKYKKMSSNLTKKGVQS